MGGYARALAAQRVLGHLDHDGLALEQKFLYALGPGLAGLVFGLQGFLHLGVHHHVAHIEKGRLFQADVHKGGLHAGQYPHHPPQVHVARHRALTLPFHENFRALAVFPPEPPWFHRCARL